MLKETINDLIAMAAAFAVLLSLCFGCQEHRAKQQLHELTKARGVAAVAVIQHDEPTPAPEPASDVCPNCKGRGEVGDGTIMKRCIVCDGTGKRTSEPEPREEKSVLTRFTLDESAFEGMMPAVPVQAILVGSESCPPCKLMKLEIEKRLVPSGWTFSEDPADVPDILYTEHWEAYGMVEGEPLPTVLIQVNGETVKKLKGYHDYERLTHEINLERKKPRAEKYEAITGGTLQAKDEIGQAIDGAAKFLGDGGSITFQRPAGVVNLDKATVTFTAQTTISAKYANDSIVLTCNPPPRIKIAGIPILAPGVNAVTVGRSSITVDLLRWPDVLINVR